MARTVGRGGVYRLKDSHPLEKQENTSAFPVHRPIAWWSVVPQLAVMAMLIIIAAIVLRPNPIILAATYGAAVYLIYSNLSKAILLKSHREGMRLSRNGDYEQAIAKYQESYRFFSKYPWIDRYRFIVTLDSAAIRYREMALINAGYCCAALGDLPRAAQYCERALAEFPDSELAKNNLNQIVEYERQNISENR